MMRNMTGNRYVKIVNKEELYTVRQEGHMEDEEESIRKVYASFRGTFLADRPINLLLSSQIKPFFSLLCFLGILISCMEVKDIASNSFP